MCAMTQCGHMICEGRQYCIVEPRQPVAHDEEVSHEVAALQS